LIIKIIIEQASLKNFKPNDLAYLDYDRSYDRNTDIVLATGGPGFNSQLCQYLIHVKVSILMLLSYRAP